MLVCRAKREKNKGLLGFWVSRGSSPRITSWTQKWRSMGRDERRFFFILLHFLSAGYELDNLLLVKNVILAIYSSLTLFYQALFPGRGKCFICWNRAWLSAALMSATFLSAVCFFEFWLRRAAQKFCSFPLNERQVRANLLLRTLLIPYFPLLFC